MFEIYPAKYRDEFGEEMTTLQNDGKSLHMILCGIEFKGFMLDDREPTAVILTSVAFPLRYGALCSYKLECEIPVPVVGHDGILPGTLRVHLDLGAPKEKGYDRAHPDIELLQLKQVTVVHHFSDKAIVAHDFPGQALTVCRAMKPFLDYLNATLA
jgi:uncharacterized protein DUF6304/uncharacterized protein DUF2461